MSSSPAAVLVGSARDDCVADRWPRFLVENVPTIGSGQQLIASGSGAIACSPCSLGA